MPKNTVHARKTLFTDGGSRRQTAVLGCYSARATVLGHRPGWFSHRFSSLLGDLVSSSAISSSCSAFPSRCSAGSRTSSAVLVQGYRPEFSSTLHQRSRLFPDLQFTSKVLVPVHELSSRPRQPGFSSSATARTSSDRPTHTKCSTLFLLGCDLVYSDTDPAILDHLGTCSGPARTSSAATWPSRSATRHSSATPIITRQQLDQPVQLGQPDPVRPDPPQI